MKMTLRKWWIKKEPKPPRNRYYTYDSEGIKICRLFEKDPGEPWRRGTGPRDVLVTEKMSAIAKQTHTGVPKSTQQKEKMSAAKLGIPKSPEHRAALLESHRLRTIRVKELQKKYPKLSWGEAQRLEKELRKGNKTNEDM